MASEADGANAANESCPEGEVPSPAPILDARPPVPPREAMWTEVLALLPAVAWAVYVFGPRVLTVAGIGIASAVATDGLLQLARRKRVSVHDGHAFLSGLLVALMLPVHVPWYVPTTASVVAMALVKQLLGGLGWTVWNPALVGRAVVMAVWAPLVLAGPNWPTALWYQKAEKPKAATAGAGNAERDAELDAVTGATPLSKVADRLREFNKGQRGTIAAPKSVQEARKAWRSLQDETATPLDDLYFGRRGGCIGEVSVAALFIGGIVLVAVGRIRWHVPVLFIGTVALLGWALPIPIQGAGLKHFLWFAGDPAFEVLSGGLFLGAFFLATDPVASPPTLRGQVLFAIGCGALTVLIRRYSGYPEGVGYAILLMNTATPLIHRLTKPRAPGRGTTT